MKTFLIVLAVIFFLGSPAIFPPMTFIVYPLAIVVGILWGISESKNCHKKADEISDEDAIITFYLLKKKKENQDN